MKIKKAIGTSGVTNSIPVTCVSSCGCLDCLFIEHCMSLYPGILPVEWALLPKNELFKKISYYDKRTS